MTHYEERPYQQEAIAEGVAAFAERSEWPSMLLSAMTGMLTIPEYGRERLVTSQTMDATRRDARKTIPSLPLKWSAFQILSRKRTTAGPYSP